MEDERLLITVDLDRYEALVADEERNNCLVRIIRNKLQKAVDRIEEEGPASYRSVSGVDLNVEDICIALGAQAVFNGFVEREKEAIQKWKGSLVKNDDAI